MILQVLYFFKYIFIGTGKGGECIYGKYFEDEIVPEIKHDRRGIVSMANSGKDTN